MALKFTAVLPEACPPAFPPPTLSSCLLAATLWTTRSPPSTYPAPVRLPASLPPACRLPLQDERSQHKNKAKAMKVLRARMFEAEQQRQRLSQSRERKEQMGSGDRSERIRTYNFPQVCSAVVCGVWCACHCKL